MFDQIQTPFCSIYLSDKQPILFGKNPQKSAFSENSLGIPEEREYRGQEDT
jgi:hypothetical protein